MFRIEDGVVYLTKGDSATINVTLTNANGEKYNMVKGDNLKMTVRASASKDAPLIFEKVSRNVPVINILPEDTENAGVGQYSCDIQLETADGHRYTVFPTFSDSNKLRAETNWRNFWVTPEVTV